MKILFTTRHINSPSTILNVSKLKSLNSMNGISIDFYNTDYANYDVVLFMGYDADIKGARGKNSDIKIGVIDPRPSHKDQPSGADFILANGIEMKDWYLKFTHNIFIYYIYPELQLKMKEHHATEKIILGYHGNAIHLKTMYPRITKAIEKLSDSYEVELWVMYNVKELGKWSTGLPDIKKVKVRHIQWSEENYTEYLSRVDIGIVPNIIPTYTVKQNKSRKIKAKLFNEHDTDYLLGFKATSNAGRIIVFAQLGIPVIADMFPSALQLLEDGVNGFVCYSTEAWYLALKQLAYDATLRSNLAKNLQTKFKETMSPMILNKNLIDFIRGM